MTVGGYDPDLDVSRARYEFLDGRGALIGDALEIDLVDAIRTSGMARVQSFKLEQRFAGQSGGRAVSVPLTLFDPGSSVTETSRP